MFDGFQTIKWNRPIRVGIELDAPVGELFSQMGERFPTADLVRKRLDQVRSLLLVDLTFPSHPFQVLLELLGGLALCVQSKMLMVEI